MRSLRTAAVALVALVGTSGCTEIENTLAKVPFLAFMHSSPMIDPYEMPRPAPEGSVPVRDPFGVAPYANGNTIADLQDLASRASNPIQPGDTAALVHGQAMFLRHCMVCHGPTGQGMGPITGPDRFPMGPSLVSPIVAGYSDGYVYAIVRQGRGLMPAYGPRMTELERWQVVAYVRSLAASGGTAAASAPASATPAAGSAAAPATDTATPQR
ncbi:MAG TPA: cytochrome c [Longimicrobiales bacterium]